MRPRPTRLGDLVAMVWLYDGTTSGRDLVVPTGRAQIVVDLEGRTHRWRVDGVAHEAGPAVLGGPSCRSVEIERRPGPLLGIVFRPTGLRPFLDRPVSEVANQHLDLHEVAPWAAELVDVACGIPPDQVGPAVLDVLQRSATRVDPGLATLVDRAATARVRDLATASGLSTRQLRALFAEHVGLSPKQWSRVQRVARALTGLRHSDDLAALAQHLGFYDHAHFTRAFRAVAGRPPSAWRAAVGPWDTHVAL